MCLIDNESLSLLLRDFVAAEAQRLDEVYDWDIPDPWPTCAFERGSDSSAKANIRLKRALSAAWHERPTDRASIERWYVSNWGGVRANRDATLAAYAASSDEELLRRGVVGVASWSKILVIRKPERYVIYDARVGAALNALQIVRGCGPPLLFPQVPSRNSVIRQYHTNETAMAAAASRVRSSQAYRTYLDLVTGVARQLNLEMLDTIEMALFANAEKLAGEALARQQNARIAGAQVRPFPAAPTHRRNTKS